MAKIKSATLIFTHVQSTMSVKNTASCGISNADDARISSRRAYKLRYATVATIVSLNKPIARRTTLLSEKIRRKPARGSIREMSGAIFSGSQSSPVCMRLMTTAVTNRMPSGGRSTLPRFQSVPFQRAETAAMSVCNTGSLNWSFVSWKKNVATPPPMISISDKAVTRIVAAVKSWLCAI